MYEQIVYRYIDVNSKLKIYNTARLTIRPEQQQATLSIFTSSERRELAER